MPELSTGLLEESDPKREKKYAHSPDLAEDSSLAREEA